MIDEADHFAPVSVVIPCFCCSRTIGRAVNSVAQQSRIPAELILVDDASNDDTWIVLVGLERNYPGWIKLLRLEKNQGAANARNAGWSAASQPYIAFLDSDDAWHPRKIDIQYDYMQANPDVVLCGHGHRILSQSSLPDWKVAPGTVQRIGKWNLILSNRFVTPSAMVRFDIGQRFIEKQRYMEDHMLWLEIICNGGHVVKMATELTAIYKGSFGVSGLSSKIWLMELADLGNYYRLYRQRFINGYQFLILGVYSLLKYSRRIFIYGAYLRWKK
jgi:glycosyltransferase involved in cell wall biosynthesis